VADQSKLPKKQVIPTRWKNIDVPKFDEALMAALASDNDQVRGTALVSVLAKVGVQDIVKWNNFKLETRDGFRKATDAVFEIVGGLPRYARWANENPGQFYALMEKVNKNNIHLHNEGGNINVTTNVPPSPLDGVQHPGLPVLDVLPIKPDDLEQSDLDEDA
jgi:hypothetical protein